MWLTRDSHVTHTWHESRFVVYDLFAFWTKTIHNIHVTYHLLTIQYTHDSQHTRDSQHTHVTHNTHTWLTIHTWLTTHTCDSQHTHVPHTVSVHEKLLAALLVQVLDDIQITVLTCYKQARGAVLHTYIECVFVSVCSFCVCFHVLASMCLFWNVCEICFSCKFCSAHMCMCTCT